MKYQLEENILERILQKQPIDSMNLRADFMNYLTQYKPAFERLQYFQLIKTVTHEGEHTITLTEKGYDAIEIGFYNWVKSKVKNELDGCRFSLKNNPTTVEIRAFKELKTHNPEITLSKPEQASIPTKTDLRKVFSSLNDIWRGIIVTVIGGIILALIVKFAGIA